MHRMHVASEAISNNGIMKPGQHAFTSPPQNLILNTMWVVGYDLSAQNKCYRLQLLEAYLGKVWGWVDAMNSKFADIIF